MSPNDVKQTNIQNYSPLRHPSAQSPPGALGSLENKYSKSVLQEPLGARPASSPGSRSPCCCVLHSFCSRHTSFLHFSSIVWAHFTPWSIHTCHFLFLKYIFPHSPVFFRSFKVPFLLLSDLKFLPSVDVFLLPAFLVPCLAFRTDHSLRYNLFSFLLSHFLCSFCLIIYLTR